MKWYFACNEKSPHFFPLIKGAVESAIRNTTLKPHFIYDGKENELTQWLEEKGVKIIYHRVSFYDALHKFYDENLLDIASGAFLRCDIPLLETEDEFVLYTDCDVLFLKDFETEIKPKYFACSTQFDKKNFVDFNTGVMLMNVNRLRQEHKKFVDFTIRHLNLLPAFDQTAYQIFYRNKNAKLPVVFNHKPYWGIDKNAFIVHFHGAKPTMFANETILKNLPYIHYKLYKKDIAAYDYYLELFREYNPEVEYCLEGIEKLKSGQYPQEKKSTTSLMTKIKNRLVKRFKFANKFMGHL